MSSWYRWHGTELIIDLLVLANSAKDQVVGVHADALKVKITALAIDNKANQHLCRLIAELCGVSRSRVKLESGQLQRRKRIRISFSKRILPKILSDY